MKRQAFIYIAVFILCLLLYLLLHDGREKRPAEYIRYHNDTLRCAIQIESRLSSVEGRGVGFSYELLNYFAETLNTSAIMAYYKGDVWKNLQDGKLDIVVINTNQTTPPLEKYRL
ncbi:MAG: hypothetical protein HUJ90_06640, partial [Bacteroidales bacterium]|nr:hypothetical protein [Bacteroidales bacterium]